MSGEALETIHETYPNVQIKTFPPKGTNTLHKATKEKLAEMAANDPLSKEIIDSQHEYLRKSRKWTNISDKVHLDSVSVENQ